jgi:hypothetical protein
VKTELADRFDSCGEAKMALFDYIEVFYNQRRRHSTIGQISPAAYERRALEEGMDAMENRTQNAVSHRAHTRRFSLEKKKEDLLKQRSQPVHGIGSGPIVSSMFMRVTLRCAHQLRPTTNELTGPSRVSDVAQPHRDPPRTAGARRDVTRLINTITGTEFQP